LKRAESMFVLGIFILQSGICSCHIVVTGANARLLSLFTT
jgi:hypothetical protein